MTFEWVKWRRWPRISQMPSSGSCHASLEVVEQRALDGATPAGRSGSRADARLVERVDHLAVDVELELLARRVADADRRGALVAGEPRELELGEAPLAGDAVHDLQVAGIAGDRAEEPAPPLGRLARRGLHWSRASSVSVASRSQQ